MREEVYEATKPKGVEVTPDNAPLLVKPTVPITLNPGDEMGYRIYDDGDVEIVVRRASRAKRASVKALAKLGREQGLEFKGKGRL